MRRALQLAAAGRLQLASSTHATAGGQQLFLQQLHSTSTPEASASAAAAPAFASGAQDGAYSARSLDFFDSRLQINEWGAVSSIPNNDPAPHLRASSSSYANHDGMRVDDGRYKAFLQDAAAVLPQPRIFTDPLHLLAYGSDASFYRLLPKAVIKVHTEAEVQGLLRLSQAHQVPVTFRAAGTSLSGQAVSDSIIISVGYVGKNFRNISIKDDGSRVTAEVGLLGGEVNKLLAGHARRHKLPISHRIGPDPASIDAAMIGESHGQLAAELSGLAREVQGDPQLAARIRAKYKIKNTVRAAVHGPRPPAAASQRAWPCQSGTHHAAASLHKLMLCHCRAYLLATSLLGYMHVTPHHPCAACRTNPAQVGYSLNALVDFPPDDPITILKHLMVGSEGTLGFISSVTYNTVPEVHHKASAFVLFPDLRSACDSVRHLKDSGVASAVEICDYASLRLAQQEFVSLVAELGQAQEGAAGLLIEVKGETEQQLQRRIEAAQQALRASGVHFGGQPGAPLGLESYPFRNNPSETKVFWDFRKGLIPIIGGSRSVGTSMMIEDVVCPAEHLAGMTADLQALFRECGYSDASAVGHALEGNLHLVFAQGFRTPEEVATFGRLMSGMADIVVHKYNGSLKGEHGTGRNMAPFVELEWGSRATGIMRRIKAAFDPHNLLNPGVILNDDPAAHMQFLKPSPPASSLIDNCMECGYCEAFCPSRDVTITPRQRIQTYREITRLKGLPHPTQEQQRRLSQMEDAWQYDGDSTCAADGMCAVRCPVNINTGEFTKQLRTAAVDGLDAGAGAASGSTSSAWGGRLAMMGANHFRLINGGVPLLLNTVDFFHGLLGPKLLEVVSSKLNKWTRNLVPVWNPYIPKGAKALSARPSAPTPSQLPTQAAQATQSGIPRQVVFLPTCVNRMMGPARGDDCHSGSTLDVFTRLAGKAGYQVIVPQGVSELCCGMMFDSRGAKKAAGFKCAEAITALSMASQMGKLPIVIDNSPCLAQFKSAGLNQQELKFSLYEPVGFTSLFLAPALDFQRLPRSVALHVPCTSKQAPGLSEKFVQLAEQCAASVTPTGIPCCGMAGDRGLRFPELTASACQHIHLPGDVTDGYSTSRTCEIGVSNAAGLHFRSMLFLLDEASRPKPGFRERAKELPQEQVGQDGARPSLTNVHEAGGAGGGMTSV
ncbi:glycolate dehydrogenase [Scenedesmus sp. NREL 46B-D3]|nr:glycolate dehydrogenase [Scenedesmus sp. NREL 46B-D3]